MQFNMKVEIIVSKLVFHATHTMPFAYTITPTQ